MRILHIENTAGVATLLSKGQRALGHDSDVLETWRCYFDNAHDFEHYYEGTFFHKLRMMSKTVELAKKYDVVHIHSGIARNRIDYALIKKILGKPLIVHYHGSETRLGYGMRHQKLADVKIVATPDLLSYHPDAVFIPNPMEPMDASWPDGDLRFLHLPSVRSKKGTEHILRAIENLSVEGRKVNFVLREHIPHDQALREIAQANVIIDQVSSQVDGAPAGLLGMVSLEGMALAKAVVNSMSMDSNGYGRFYPQGYPGIFGDERTIKDVIVSLLDDPGEARQRGEKGRQWISEHLNLQIIARQHLRIYERVLNEDPQSPHSS